MFKRKFVTNLIFLLLLNFLVKPIWIFGIDRTVQNIVSPEQYGLYFSILNFSFLFNIILDFGITNFNNRNIAQNSFLLNKHFSSLIVIRFILGMVYFVIIYAVALIIGYDKQHLYFLFFLALNQFLASLILYLRSNISGLLMFKTDSIISVLDRTLMIVICSVLIWGRITDKQFDILWFIYAQTASYLLTALVAFIIVARKSKFRKLTWNFTFFLVILKKSLPFALLVLLMSFYNRIDAVMLERLLGDNLGTSQANVYGKAFRWLEAVNMVSYLFSVLLLPIFSRLIKERQSVNEIIRTSFILLFTFVIIAGIQSSFYGEEIIDLLYYSQQEESTAVFKIIILCCIPVGMVYIFGTLLTANNNLRELNIVSAIALTINLVINLILIPKYMALGSAVASVTTQFFTAIVQIILVIKIFKIKISKGFIARVVAFVLSIIAVNVIFKYIDYNWIAEFLLVGLISLLLAVLLGLFKLKSFAMLIKSRENEN
ncbi:MAG: oligosaccharide flippase family protein [Bacteroidales bacterium]